MNVNINYVSLNQTDHGSCIVYLVTPFTSAEQTDRLWSGGDGCEDAEATHQPHILHSTVLLTDTRKERVRGFFAGITKKTRC